MIYDEMLAKYGKIEAMVGQNSSGEDVIISIDDEAVSMRTLQSNRWMRTNIYYKDGSQEEVYER